MDGHRTGTIAPCAVPLSVPGSRRVERCYAMPGKGSRIHAEARVELVLVDEERDVWNVLGVHHAASRFSSSAVPTDASWRVLGWRMADGSMPFGDYDLVDPDLAMFERLPVPERADARPVADDGCPHLTT